MTKVEVNTKSQPVTVKPHLRAQTALEVVIEQDYRHNEEWKRLVGGLDFNGPLKELEKVEAAIRMDILRLEAAIELRKAALDDLAAERERYERAATAWANANE